MRSVTAQEIQQAARHLSDQLTEIKDKKERRGTEVETPFGDLKYNRQFDRFLLCGLEKADHEFGLHCIAHNIRKINQIEMKKVA
ncbi:MAG TPA: hypothetical protein ENH09_01965 [Bacteroidetes bacterium]|nr:hypothetical protein [Bacteroidota bacterium]